MTTEELYAAAMAKELPECNLLDYHCGKFSEAGTCPCCDGTGKQGGDEAILRDKALKAEMEHHWDEYERYRTAKNAPDMIMYDKYYLAMMGNHAAAIARIAGYLEATDG